MIRNFLGLRFFGFGIEGHGALDRNARPQILRGGLPVVVERPSLDAGLGGLVTMSGERHHGAGTLEVRAKGLLQHLLALLQ